MAAPEAISYTMLPEKENLIRLRTCDFNTQGEWNDPTLKKQLKKSKIPCTLKTISNPMLILFYFNETNDNLISQFYLSTFEKNLQKGNTEEKLFDTAEDLDFKFGFVNLDMEDGVRETFSNMSHFSHPFLWAKLENMAPAVAPPLPPPPPEYYPFIIFYYHTIPQFMYEGVVEHSTIGREFKNWRSELLEVEEKKLKNTRKKMAFNEGYYTALRDNFPVPGFRKGVSYFVTYQNGEYRFNRV